MEKTNKQSEFTQNQFQKAAEAGAFSRVVVRAGWSHFSIFGQMRGGGEASLTATRQKRTPREFRNPAAALVLLRQIGVMRVEVEMESWDLEMTALSMRLRPDVTARRLREKRIVEAAYYPGVKLETGELGRQGELRKLVERRVSSAKGTY